jgi:hypothetical protein
MEQLSLTGAEKQSLRVKKLTWADRFLQAGCELLPDNLARKIGKRSPLTQGDVLNVPANFPDVLPTSQPFPFYSSIGGGIYSAFLFK